MGNIKDIHVSAVIGEYRRAERSFPITPRENFMRALAHEKPLWMPNYYADIQHVGPGGIGFIGVDFGAAMVDGAEFVNAWGCRFRYSEAQGSPTPIGYLLTDITKWKSEVRFPDYTKMDIVSSPPGFARDETLASYTHLESVAFEQLHMQEGFEQALIDLISEPAACREFFEYNVDYQLEVFKRQHAAHRFDFVLYHDDWGTQRAPFFSMDLFEETILPPTIRLCKEIQQLGCRFLFHNCGKIDGFMGHIAHDVGADGIQLQNINDISGILAQYGDRITPEYQNPDPYIMFDPESTEADIRALARGIVDRYGAHNNPGAGAYVSINAPDERVYGWFDDEIYTYSLSRYSDL